MFRPFLTAALVVTCMIANADEPLPAELPPAQESAALKAAEATGLSIYLHDHAAAVATDAMQAIRGFKKDKRVSGWITQDQGDDIVVTFIGNESDKPAEALYRATISAKGTLVGNVAAFENPVPLTAFESGAAAARASAMASRFSPCSEQYNSVVLPADDGTSKRWIAYLLPATTSNDVVPLGGTYRVETNWSGREILSSRAFTRTCIALHTGQRVAGLMITHLLDATPTEAHVFWSLWAHKPMYVATPPNGTVWAIDGGKIRLVKRAKTDG